MGDMAIWSKGGRAPRGLPDDTVDILERRVAHWRRLDDDERAHLVDDIDWLLRAKRWEAAAGFALDDEMRVVLAAQAAVLLLGLERDHLQLVTTFVVHPTTTQTFGERPGHVAGTYTDEPMDVDGLAEDLRGPVLVAWDAAADAARHPTRGFDVVAHELAHKLDMLDGLVDGTPLLPVGPARDRWVEVCAGVFASLVEDDQGHPPLDPYGAEDPGEFFAVATEAFFGNPVELEGNEPALYAVLRDFYGQDPAGRQRRRPRAKSQTAPSR